MKQIRTIFNDFVYHVRYHPSTAVKKAFVRDMILLLEYEGILAPNAPLGPVGRNLLGVISSKGLIPFALMTDVIEQDYTVVKERGDEPPIDVSPEALLRSLSSSNDDSHE